MSLPAQITSALLRSTRMKYESDIQSAKSTLLVYFNNSVAIGEHPQHLEEIDTLLDKMASAQDKLDILNKNESYFKGEEREVEGYNTGEMDPLNLSK